MIEPSYWLKQGEEGTRMGLESGLLCPPGFLPFRGWPTRISTLENSQRIIINKF